MKQSNRMAKIIVELCNKHGFDLSAPYGHLRLEMGGYQPLVIEKHGPTTVAVMHIASDGIVDPMFRFEAHKIDGNPIDWHSPNIQEWFVTDTAMAWNGGRVKQVAIRDGETAYRTNDHLQHDAATFANDWATELKDQDWLADATVVSSWNSNDGTAAVIHTDGRILVTIPNQLEDNTERAAGFTLKELYTLLDCSMIEEIHCMESDWVMLGDEDGRAVDEPEMNDIALRFSKWDRYEPYNQIGLVGNVVITPERWFR